MSQFSKIVLPIACLLSTNLAYADSTNFKRWAVSAGWMHVMPQGKANSTHVTTAVEEGGSYGVGHYGVQILKNMRPTIRI